MSLADLEFGLRTTILGMGIVFGLLLLLWGLLALALRFERAGPPSGAPTPTFEGGMPVTALPDPGRPRVRIEGPAALDPVVVAAITVAVLRHAEARRLQAAPAMRSYWPGSLLFASRWVAAGRTRQGQHWPRRR